MGSYSSLYLNEIRLFSVKNTTGFWGEYFSQKDLTTAVYTHYSDNGKIIKSRRPALVKKLKDIVRHLELSGVEKQNRDPVFYSERMQEIEPGVCLEIINRLQKISVDEIRENPEYFSGKYGVPQYSFPDEYLNKLQEIPGTDIIDLVPFENLLYALSKNPANSRAKLIWQHYDVIEGGWEDEDEFLHSLSKKQSRFLIITEGSSDSHVIAKALKILEPTVSGLFEFIDMTENYPFTGTGNLFKFCQGLTKIQVAGQVIVIFDNDTEGVSKYNDVLNLKLPSNIRPMVLPNLKSVEKFKTIGPDKETYSNLNGKAVSIELFLDLAYKMRGPPKVRWVSYDSKLDQYQGSLVNKDEYLRKFMSMRPNTERYNYKKLRTLVSAIFELCSEFYKDKL